MMPKHFLQIIINLVFFLLLTNPTMVMGQSGKIDKLRGKADANFRLKNYVEAEDGYKTVIQSEPNNFEVAYRLGRINDFLSDYQDALQWYTRAADIDPARNDTVYFYIGVTYKRLSNYRKAKEALIEFQKRHTFEGEYAERTVKEIEGCDIAEAAAGKRPRYDISNLSFNSPFLDAFPSLFDQGQEDKFIVFTSHRPSKGKRNRAYQGLGQPAFSDLFMVIKENDSVFSSERNFGKPINTKMNDGTATFTGDGLTMLYTICNNRKNKEGCSIYESRYDPSRKRWSKPRILDNIAAYKEILVNTRGKVKRVPTDDRHPTLSPDGRTLLFASDRSGGEGGFDIWISHRVGTGWSAPENVGTIINTPFDEYSPFLSKESGFLYFASNGHGGFGGFDLYRSEGAPDNLQAPVNLGSPLNTSYDDLSGVWMEGDSVFFFSSNRPGGKGSLDIYRGGKRTIPLGSLDITVQGLIRDRKTKQPIPFATAILYEYQGTGSILPIDTFETDQTARYNFPLIRNRNYKILGNAPEYLANEEEVTTMGIEEDTDIEQNIDIELEPIVIGFPIVLQNIYYDFDEYYLRSDAVVELNELIQILRKNPNIMIQLGSHTDTNGTIKYNDGLSEDRAKAAIRYLVDNGVNPARLSWFGFGESQPLIYPELSDDDEQSNRRTEFRILSIDFGDN